LPPSFGGNALFGNGIDEEALKRAGIEDADVFVALTQGDNRNVMSCQIAKHIFNVPRVVCRIYDPLREEMYNALGLETLSPTKIFAQLFREKIEG
jgi:trk system potassium uptake protein TrkA